MTEIGPMTEIDRMIGQLELAVHEAEATEGQSDMQRRAYAALLDDAVSDFASLAHEQGLVEAHSYHTAYVPVPIGTRYLGALGGQFVLGVQPSTESYGVRAGYQTLRLTLVEFDPLAYADDADYRATPYRDRDNAPISRWIKTEPGEWERTEERARRLEGFAGVLNWIQKSRND